MHVCMYSVCTSVIFIFSSVTLLFMCDMTDSVIHTECKYAAVCYTKGRRHLCLALLLLLPMISAPSKSTQIRPPYTDLGQLLACILAIGILTVLHACFMVILSQMTLRINHDPACQHSQ